MPISDVRLTKAQIKLGTNGGAYFDGFGTLSGEDMPLGFRTFGETEAMHKIKAMIEAHGKINGSSPLLMTVGYEISKGTYRGKETTTVMITKAAPLGCRPVIDLEAVKIYRIRRPAKADGQPADWLELKAIFEDRKLVIEAEGALIDAIQGDIAAAGRTFSEVNRESPLPMNLKGDFIYRSFAADREDQGFKVRSFKLEAFEMLPDMSHRPPTP